MLKTISHDLSERGICADAIRTDAWEVVMTDNIPVVILCGGMGTRLREETEFKPKPLVEIGGKPVLWHIMKTYAHNGFRRFILCLGYKGNMIKDYFLNYEAMEQ